MNKEDKTMKQETENWTHPVLRLGGYKYGREASVATIAKREGVSRMWVYKNQVPLPVPELNEDGYPTEETLRVIREWPIRGNSSLKDLRTYVQQAWRYSFEISRRGVGRKAYIKVATHGWSGNEEIINALEDNILFWGLCWLESRRGGGYKFLINPVICH